MSDKATERIKAICSAFPDLKETVEFVQRVKDGQLTRDESPSSHFCVYFAAYDLVNKEVFIGHHKKSGLWLFNGGHIDQGETPEEALIREMGEEWGVEIDFQNIGEPKLLTITPIKQLTIKCTRHYDIWYFVPVSKSSFSPDKEKLDTEFYTTGWKTVKEAKNLISDPNTLKAISELEILFNNAVEEGGTHG
jgi:8-oxo-dGTP pyrophosphatase MutT (NUDIX family)